MPVLSVDLACRNWSDLGVVLLEQKGQRIACEIFHWQDKAAPSVVELAIRLNTLCLERKVNILTLDGPQAWKSEGNGHPFCRASELPLCLPGESAASAILRKPARR